MPIHKNDRMDLRSGPAFACLHLWSAASSLQDSRLLLWSSARHSQLALAVLEPRFSLADLQIQITRGRRGQRLGRMGRCSRSTRKGRRWTSSWRVAEALKILTRPNGNKERHRGVIATRSPVRRAHMSQYSIIGCSPLARHRLAPRHGVNYYDHAKGKRFNADWTECIRGEPPAHLQGLRHP
jgi:hypothetical protein